MNKLVDNLCAIHANVANRVKKIDKTHTFMPRLGSPFKLLTCADHKKRACQGKSPENRSSPCASAETHGAQTLASSCVCPFFQESFATTPL